MLRSIDYAAAVGGAGSEPDRREAWRHAARGAFLDAYLAAPETGPLLPRTRKGTDDVLFVMELEKVLYEIDYETAHRPDWVDIPVQGLRSLAELGLVG
jgi:maltose alpha-D-glucosyltransferase/alpha-amylase